MTAPVVLVDSLAVRCSPTPTRHPTHLPHLSQDALKYLLNLTIKHHFITDIVCGWYEAGEDEDGGEVLVRAVTAVPLLLLRLAVTDSRYLRRRSHLRSRDQLRTRCRLRIPGQTGPTAATSPRGFTHGRQGPGVTRLLRVVNRDLRHPTPTAPGSPSAPLRLAQHLLHRRGPTIDDLTTTYNGYVGR